MAAADPIEKSLNEIQQIMRRGLDMMGEVALQHELENYLENFVNAKVAAKKDLKNI
tara:strand:+ start:505 stop:672 length:168 start_codon:yes stop_codon:yes gene_type:complete